MSEDLRPYWHGRVFGIGGVPTRESLDAHLRGRGLSSDEIAAARAPARRRFSVADAARRIGRRDVLQLNMTRDEVVPVPAALALFDALQGPKRLAFWEGGHIDLPNEAIDMAIRFLRERLRGDCSDARAEHEGIQ